MSDTPEAPSPSPPEVAILTLAEEPEAWAAAGFAVDEGGTCRLGHVTLELIGREAGTGVVGWALRGLPEGAATDLEGFPTRATDQGRAQPAEHPCSAVAVDHLVLLSDDLERTVGAAATVGLTPRRWRDHVLPDGTEARQAFFRVGQVVLEVVAPRARPAQPRPGVRAFGLAVTALDIERARACLGDALGPTRPAVQPGRFIATVRRGAHGLTIPLALMSPAPRRPPGPAGGPPPADGRAGDAPAGPSDADPSSTDPSDADPSDSGPSDPGPSDSEPEGPFAIPG
ncbi:MAG TPA: hypothetical protein VEW93_14845 [Acidimicrobiales bacterium]|nr:hypothetical protein [Acidimicrobiales bacterium]